MRICSAIALVLIAICTCSATAEDKWIKLWDGKTFDGWKASENKDSWKIENGAIVAFGPRSHLFYVGDDAPFVNFHFKSEVMTKPGANAGIYFHTKYQDEGWPKYGYEAQVNATHRDPKKTGSLYAVQNTDKANHKDNEWYTEEIIVNGRNIKIIVNGETVVDFTEEEDRQPGEGFTRILDPKGGTFAFQAHDPKSEVHFRNIMVKRLP